MTASSVPKQRVVEQIERSSEHACIAQGRGRQEPRCDESGSYPAWCAGCKLSATQRSAGSGTPPRDKEG